MNYYTHEDIEKYAKENPHEFFMFDDDFSLMGGLYYKLTEGELGWLDFVRGRYGVADYIDENMDENGFVFFDPFEFSQVLRDDGMEYKAVCLSDDTSLQKVFFYGYLEEEQI